MKNRIISMMLPAILLMGCATAGKMNRISVGMSKEDVILRMGKPTSTSAKNGVEYLNYALSETGDDAFYGRTSPYFVRIVDDRVDAYGRQGDFDSTKDATQVIKIQADTRSDQNVLVRSGDSVEDKLFKLKSLLANGLITKDEYESRKNQILDEFSKQ